MNAILYVRIGDLAYLADLEMFFQLPHLLWWSGCFEHNG